eukprot:jgi/Mesvir1/10020/Mv03643-RA.1
MPRKFFAAGNWKCNGKKDAAKALVDILNGASWNPADVDVLVAPPAVHLQLVRDAVKKDVMVGAQNCWKGDGGAWTGEISAEMLADLGVEWVILGHSERRRTPQLQESNEFIAEKAIYAAGKGVKVIFCVGESIGERLAERTMSVITEQLAPLAAICNDWKDIVIAYEPVWAIGTGKVATPAQAQEVHAHIRAWLKKHVSAEVADTTRILYGGSVNGKNCRELATQPDVDGFLVGGASLKAEFVDIINSRK